MQSVYFRSGFKRSPTGMGVFAVTGCSDDQKSPVQTLPCYLLLYRKHSLIESTRCYLCCIEAKVRSRTTPRKRPEV